jgi:hypothetical protein
VGDVRLRGAIDSGPGTCSGAPCSSGSGHVPVRLDGMRMAVVVGSELETHTAVSHPDGGGVDAPIHSGGMCCIPTKAGGGLDLRCALVADMDGTRAVDTGGSELDTCAGASSIGTAVNPLVVVVYLPLTVQSVSDTSVLTN